MICGSERGKMRSLRVDDICNKIDSDISRERQKFCDILKIFSLLSSCELIIDRMPINATDQI